MTTVAWDGKTIAADRQATASYGHKRDVGKLHHCGEFIVGATGNYAESLRVAEWVRSGGKPPEDIDAATHGLAVNLKTGRAYVIEGKPMTMTDVNESCFAVGSGGEYAAAAMYLGKEAADAVRVAHHFDAFTGDAVDCVTLHLDKP